MKKTFLMAFLTAAAFCSCTNDEPQSSQGNNTIQNDEPSKPQLPHVYSMETMAHANFSEDEMVANKMLNDFSFNLIQLISQNYKDVFDDSQKENFCISPLSATLNIAMIANSGDYATHKNIANSMGVDDWENVNIACNKLLRYLPYEGNGAILNIANSIWYNNNFSISPNYIEQMQKVFGTDAFSFDSNEPDLAVKLINDWCHDKTNGMIPKFLHNIDQATKILLLSALYFNGQWATEIDKTLTQKEEFHGSITSNFVDMMNTKIKTNLYTNEKYSAVGIPFKRNSTQLILILPHENSNIIEVGNNLSYSARLDWPKNAQMANASIKFPCFSLSQTIRLNKVLSLLKINLSDINLSNIGIPYNTNFDVIQKTTAIVNEEGAKIAAITGASAETGNNQNPQYIDVELTFNRPFLFLIENTKSGSILMAGRICNI